MKRIFLSTTATCWPSLTDFSLIKNYFKKNGWILSKKIDNAEVILIYTCAVRKHKEDASIEFIKKALKEKNRKAQVVVAGCLPIMNKARLNRIFNGTTISANSLQALDELFNSKARLREIKYVGLTSKSAKNKQFIYPLRIGWGCKGKCTFCAVKFVFGKSHSRPVTDILQEFNNACMMGYRRFVLVSNDAGCFGQDLGLSLEYLLNKLCQKNKESQFTLSHMTPDKLKKKLPSLKRFIRSGRIWNIKIPVQSGNDRIIRLMGRGYTVKDFKYCVEKLRDYNPSIEIDTSIMVGFPTETEEDFQDTMKLADYLGRYIARFERFAYSDRPNTLASKMPGRVRQKIIEDRLRRLNNLCQFNYWYKNKILLGNKKTKEDISINMLGGKYSVITP